MQHKVAYLVALCCALMHMSLVSSDFAMNYTVRKSAVILFLSCKGLSYLFYPLLGWMADVCFTRYKFVLFSFITMILGSLVLIVSGTILLEFPQNRDILFYIAGMSIIIGLVGIGLFESTAIQFGLDQMMEASSGKLSTFIHWYYWSSNFGNLAILYISDMVLIYYHHCIMIQGTNSKPTRIRYQVLIANIFGICCGVLQLVCACTGLCMLVCFKRHLKIDRTGEHPVRLIYLVLKYAWYHKCPENRSAFTYWEEDIPPRIDLGKSKYGGPFTTEEVEDTKTFFRIILLFFSLLGFHLSGHGYSLIDQLARKQCASLWVGLFVGDTMHIILITVIIGVPLYQIVMVRCCQKYAPNMLKRIGLGLLCSLVKGVIEIIIHATTTKGKACKLVATNPMVSCYFISSMVKVNGTCSIPPEYSGYCNENNTPFLLMIIPNVLEGFAFLLVFMTTLEFICAQAPLRLKGLLIGIWYALLAVDYLAVGISEIFLKDITTWEVFHEAKAFLIFLSLMSYLLLSQNYSYRVRDEVVNEQFLVEEIYDRELALAEELEKENSDSYPDVILPTESRRTSSCHTVYGTY